MDGCLEIECGKAAVARLLTVNIDDDIQCKLSRNSQQCENKVNQQLLDLFQVLHATVHAQEGRRFDQGPISYHRWHLG